MAPALGRREGVLVAVCAAAAGALALNRYLVGVFYDDGLYAGLAAAVASGGGYVHPHLPGTPAAIHYPPVYPVVLAPLYAAFSRETAGLLGKILNLVFGAAAAGVIAAHATRIRLLGQRAPGWLAAVTVAAAAVAVPVLTTQSVLFAEPLFALLLALTVFCADRATEGPPPRWAIAAGCFAALTILTRTIGVAAGFGAVVFIGLRTWRDRPAHFKHLLGAGVPAAAAAIAWFSWTLTHRGGIDPALAINYGSYGEVLKQTGLGALGGAIADLPRPLLAITLGWLPGVAGPAFGLLAGGIALFGMWIAARRSTIGLALAGYIAILAIWPFPPDRFLWAVLPWIALVFAAGAAELMARRWARIPVAVVSLAAVIGYGIYQVDGLQRRTWRLQAEAISANFTELAEGLRELPDTAVVAVDNESLVWLYTGRPAVPLFLYGYAGGALTYPSSAEHRAYLERQHVTHVVLASSSSPSAAQLRAVIGAYPDWLKPVRQWPGGRWIFAVTP